MRKIFFHVLILFSFTLSVSSCQSARQSEISVNSTDAAPRNSAKETPPKAETAPAAPEKEAAGEQKKSTAESAPQTSSGEKFENRCGWFVNPTPANASLEDKDGEWIISVQGGYQAEGDYPEFDDKDWVKTNVNYGYGCACMRVKVDFKTHRILEIASATAKPLAACRKDPALKEPR
jgi:hypothetical protein